MLDGRRIRWGALGSHRIHAGSVEVRWGAAGGVEFVEETGTTGSARVSFLYLLLPMNFIYSNFPYTLIIVQHLEYLFCSHTIRYNSISHDLSVSSE